MTIRQDGWTAIHQTRQLYKYQNFIQPNLKNMDELTIN